MSVRRSLSLVCFPHAGGATVRYRRWQNDLPDGVKLVVPSLPGRERRLLDEPFPDVASASAYVVHQLAAQAAGDGGLALVGISYGALLAFDVAARLEATGHQVEALFVASQRAPTVRPQQVDWRRMADERLVDELRAIGGLSPEMADEEFRELFLPVIRAELHASASYLKPETYQRLRCPIFLYHGTGDSVIPAASAHPWRAETDHLTWRSLDAAHFLTGPGGEDLWFEALRDDLALVRDGRAVEHIGAGKDDLR